MKRAFPFMSCLLVSKTGYGFTNNPTPTIVKKYVQIKGISPGVQYHIIGNLDPDYSKCSSRFQRGNDIANAPSTHAAAVVLRDALKSHIIRRSPLRQAQTLWCNGTDCELSSRRRHKTSSPLITSVAIVKREAGAIMPELYGKKYQTFDFPTFVFNRSHGN
ncbi:hypothetical protein EVAR_21653_1 [Eumeta japonica]|uniref:Uncharacterized protein n=1 Tax=Eumeta variegata TaxID=151549 RepID=A0A4C1VGR4_EUMVA|nr:hypothetical protein EVAR_21653_1 [Eumeta japonica]